MAKISLIIVAVYCAAASCGCGQSAPRPARTAPAKALSGLPVEMTAGQRSTSVVSGSDRKLLLTIDDVTRNQVMVSLATDAGAVVLPARSMAPDDSATFKFGDATYLLSLKQLKNALVGDDVATFVISLPSAGVMTEEEKIDKLIAAVAALGDATFLRNGVEYSAADAADHLRTKRRAAGDEIKTAGQFIDAVASTSSTSGEPYVIRMPDGSTVQAGDYLAQQLREIESAP